MYTVCVKKRSVSVPFCLPWIKKLTGLRWNGTARKQGKREWNGMEWGGTGNKMEQDGNGPFFDA